jgi:hypothetical protein
MAVPAAFQFERRCSQMKREAGQVLAERKNDLMRSMEAIPLQVYWGLAMASVLFSAVLYLLGRRSTALFVGQWPPTFLAMALIYKLLRPSEEDASAPER